MGSRLKIFTAYDNGFEMVGRYASASCIEYANRHTFHFEKFDIEPNSRPPAWQKINLAINLLEKSEFDWYLWIDADAIFVDYEYDILNEIDITRDIHVVKHLCTSRFILDQSQTMLIQVYRPNTGVMLFKNDPWTMSFFKELWSKTEFLNHPWWEQAAFHHLIGYSAEITDLKEPNNLTNPNLSHIGWLDPRWNCVPTLSPITGLPGTANPDDPRIVHYAGMKNDERERAMRELYIQSPPSRHSGPI